MANHFFTQGDCAIAVAVETEPIEREGGIVQLVQVLVTTQQFDLSLRTELSPIVPDGPLRANPESFEVVVRLEKVGPACDLTKQLERRAIENGH